LTTPILSIITPSFNQAAFLRQTLESVAGQPVPPGSIEHIVIDGGSTDGSVEIIREFGAQLAHWVSEKDRGQSHAINKGLGLARGRFATWLNSDDWYEPGALREVVERLAAAEGPDGFDVLVGRCKFIDGEGRVVFDPRPPEPITAAAMLRLKSRWFNGRLIVQPEAFFRLAPVAALGGINEQNHYSMDHELWVRLALGGARFRTFDRHIANLRVHAAQKTASNRDVVRCLLRFARPLAEENLDRLGPEGPVAMAEIASMERKLAAADPLFERWTAAPERSAGGADEWGAAAAYLDTVGTQEEEWNRQRRELHGPRVQVGLSAVASRTRPGLRGLLAKWRVLVLSADGGEAAERVLGRFPLRRIDLTVCTIGASRLSAASRRLGLDAAGSRAGWRRSVRALRADGGRLERALGGGPFDLILTETVLMHASDPGRVVAALWGALRPGGFLLQAGEPMGGDGLRAYVESLRVRLSRQLSANDEVVIGVMTDYFLPRVAAEGALPAGMWAGAHPGAWGVGVEGLMATHAPDTEPVLRRVYGAMDYQPMAPFPTVEHVPPPGDGWIMTLWRRGE
jgi:SAM-dependent methyltransferase